MKIVKVDNYDRESINDELVAENIQQQVLGERMVSALNAHPFRNKDDYYRLVTDDYKLKVFTE